MRNVIIYNELLIILLLNNYKIIFITLLNKKYSEHVYYTFISLFIGNRSPVITCTYRGS